MKRFLKSVFAVLRKTSEAKLAGRRGRPGAAPWLEVRSQVKAGRKAGGVLP
jgi:hypothetical protein